MIPAEFHVAIYARLTADSGTGGLMTLVDSVRNTFAESGDVGAFPYVVFNVTSATPSDAFNTSAVDVSLDVHTFIREQDPTGTNTFATGMAIVKRIRGNWEAGATARVPDYGLDRFQPTLTGSGWSSSVIVPASPGYQELHGGGVLHWVQSFEVLISKAGA